MKTAEIETAIDRCVPGFHGTSDDDAVLIQQIRQGSEAAFNTLVQKHHAPIVRLARFYVSANQAEEIAQDAWIAVWKGLRDFEGRSAFKTWLFRIVINRALTAASREARADRVGASLSRDAGDEPVEASRFYADGHARAGQWLFPPQPWTPEERLLTSETLAHLQKAIEALPPIHKQVLTLRDVSGWTTSEVCELLDIAEGHQRVILHRARMRLRKALEDYLSKEKS